MSDKDYIIFVLGYDLLNDRFKNSKEPECDLVFEKCKKITENFLISKYNVNTKGLYECLEDYINNNDNSINLCINNYL